MMQTILRNSRVPSMVHKCYMATKPDIKLVSQLRKETGIAFDKCREAAVKHDNQHGPALTWLQEQEAALGLAKATKLQGRETPSGLLAVSVTPCGKTAVLTEVNCETDFVAKNEKFVSLSQLVSDAALNYSKTLADGHHTLSMADVEHAQSDNGKDVASVLLEGFRTLAENLKISRILVDKASTGMVGSYVHDGKVASLVRFRIPDGPVPTGFDLLGRQIAQQVVGMNPRVVTKEEAIAAGLDPATALLEQPFIRETKQTVAQRVKKAAKVAGVAPDTVSILHFSRWELGGK